MIRVTLDANVLTAAVPAQSGPLARLFTAWQHADFTLVLSEHILQEIERAWTKPYWQARFGGQRPARALTTLRMFADIVNADPVEHGAASHAQDDYVLATAVNGNADYLVTGDHELLRLGSHRGVRIVSPREFLSVLDAAE